MSHHSAPYEVAPLPYSFDALEPHIDRQTMMIHYGKHHQAYVTNLNKALENAIELRDWDLEQLVRDYRRAPEAVRNAVRNHGGGTWNHTFFWESMGPNKGGEPAGLAADVFRSAFGGFSTFREKFSQAATSHFGSGWAWLVRTPEGRYEIVTTPNQDNPLSDGKRPIFGLDVWEHAYYLKYQNRRADYVTAWWNVVDWEAVSRRMAEAQARSPVMASVAR
jgi:Fe-Mn family superoxide dismutase